MVRRDKALCSWGLNGLKNSKMKHKPLFLLAPPSLMHIMCCSCPAFSIIALNTSLHSLPHVSRKKDHFSCWSCAAILVYFSFRCKLIAGNRWSLSIQHSTPPVVYGRCVFRDPRHEFVAPKSMGFLPKAPQVSSISTSPAWSVAGGILPLSSYQASSGSGPPTPPDGCFLVLLVSSPATTMFIRRSRSLASCSYLRATASALVCTTSRGSGEMATRSYNSVSEGYWQ